MSCKEYRKQITENMKFDEGIRIEAVKFQARVDAGDVTAIAERRQVEEEFTADEATEKALREEYAEVDEVLSELEDANVKGANIQRLELSGAFRGMDIVKMKIALEAAKTFIKQN